jgi:hypothetical protein
MPITLNQLDERINSAFQRIQRLEGGIPLAPGPTPVAGGVTPGKLYGATAAIVLSIVIAAVGVTHAVDSQYAGLDKRLTKIEGAVKVLSSQQSDQTQKLVHDLLAAVKENPKSDSASKVLVTAGALISTLQHEKRPAPPAFFQVGIDTINQIDQAHGYIPAAFETRIKFAEYRSALEVVPEWGTSLAPSDKTKPTIQFGPEAANKQFDHIAIDLTASKGDGIKLEGNRELARNIVFMNDRIDGGTLVLDGIHWHDVYFVGTHIRYEGGELELNNVRFVNCTFEVSSSKIAPRPRAKKLLDYATLLQPELTISGE